MKPKHNAQTRLSHYEDVLKRIFGKDQGYYVCVMLSEYYDGYDVDIMIEYPEFWQQKPSFIGDPGRAWFCDNEDRIKAVERAIELVKEKISRNELD